MNRIVARKRARAWIILLVLLVLLSGCATSVTTGVSQSASRSSGKYRPPDEPSNIRSVAIESYDIESACRKMVGKMLANPLLNRSGQPVHVIVDAEYFSVQTASRLNKNLLIDQLRSELLNAAAGRIVFVGREYAGMVEHERDLKRTGAVGPATTPGAATTLGAGYRLGGRITDLTNVGGGVTERYTQMAFEMVDLETGQIVFSDTHRFKKSQALGTLYR